MPLPLAKAFTAKAIGVYFNNYVQTTGEPPYLGSGLFPSVKTAVMDLKWFKRSSCFLDTFQLRCACNN